MTSECLHRLGRKPRFNPRGHSEVPQPMPVETSRLPPSKEDMRMIIDAADEGLQTMDRYGHLFPSDDHRRAMNEIAQEHIQERLTNKHPVHVPSMCHRLAGTSRDRKGTA